MALCIFACPPAFKFIRAGAAFLTMTMTMIMAFTGIPIAPPVGFNLFVLQSMTGRDNKVIVRASLPLFACLVLCIAIITVFSATVTWLPDTAMGAPKGK